MLDPYQIVEARALGADCILLIMAALDAMRRPRELAGRRGRTGAWMCWSRSMTSAELERALRLPARLIGINNRNLKTLKVDLATTERLAPRVPRGPAPGRRERARRAGGSRPHGTRRGVASSWSANR